MSSITTTSLSRNFGPITAVDRLSLELPTTGVIGLLGPNGSGKSTLIRMLLGLIRPTGGTASVWGESIDHPARYAGRVGALVEVPAFVPALSAQKNLLSLARLRGLPDSRVDEVLSIVGLQGRASEPVKQFSLGMKQRLGIAAALLPNPDLLILDEPTNGLDPAGIVEIRGLLRELGEQGRAIVVSSHLLTEIEAACDWVVVIRFGHLVFSGPIAEIMALSQPHIDIRPEHARDAKPLAQAMTKAGWTVVKTEDDIRVMAESSRAADINRAALAAGVTLASLVVVHDTLEEIFLEMTGTDDGELAANRAKTAGEAA